MKVLFASLIVLLLATTAPAASAESLEGSAGESVGGFLTTCLIALQFVISDECLTEPPAPPADNCFEAYKFVDRYCFSLREFDRVQRELAKRRQQRWQEIDEILRGN